MRPIVLPFFEKTVRRELGKRGFASTMVDSPVGRIHVYDGKGLGSLPAVVVLHGISATSTSFAAVLARLRNHARRVIAVDYPGHGFSDDPSSPLTLDLLFDTVGNVVDDLTKGERPLVVGNSLGGVVALDYAAKRQEHLHGLVLFSPAGAPCTASEWNELLALFDVRSRKKALELVGRIHHRAPLVMRLIAHELSGPLNRRAVRDLLSTSGERSVPAEDLARLTLPILFSWGRSERLLPHSHLAWWRKHLPAHALVEEPERWGHCPHLDAPGQVAARIAAFASTIR